VRFPKPWSKGWWKERELQKIGKRFAEAPMSGGMEQVRNWCLRNKGPIGSAFVVAWSWAEVTGCPAVYGIDLVSVTGVSCLFAQKVLGAIGFLLIGGGWITKDDMERRKQVMLGKLGPRTSAEESLGAAMDAVAKIEAKAELKEEPKP
jgi:hypothetical protein